MTPSRRAFISNLFVAPAILKFGLYMPVKKIIDLPQNQETTFTVNQPSLFTGPVHLQPLSVDYFNDAWPRVEFRAIKIGDLITGPNGYEGKIVAVTNGD